MTSCLDNLGSEDTSGPDDAQLEQVRAKVSEFLIPTGGLQGRVSQAEVDADLLSAWANAVADLDVDCVNWFYTGAPLGIEREIQDPGIFPLVSDELLPQ
eukprot:3191220-Amphidinium_carterae.1